MPFCFRNILALYVDGFRSMVLGRTLWKIILIKIVVMFGIIKLFFFPDILSTTYTTDHARADHVLSTLTLEQPCGARPDK